MKLSFLNNFTQCFKSANEQLLNFFQFRRVHIKKIPAHFLWRRVPQIIPCFIIGYQSFAGEILPESGVRFIKSAPDFTANHIWSIASLRGINQAMNQSAIGFFVGIDSGTAFPTTSEFVSGKRGNQSADNASSNKPSNVHDWIYFFAHDIFKIVLCGAIGGIVATCIVEVWPTRKKPKQTGEIIGEIIGSKNGAIVLGDVSQIRAALPKIQELK